MVDNKCKITLVTHIFQFYHSTESFGYGCYYNYFFFLLALEKIKNIYVTQAIGLNFIQNSNHCH